MWISTPIGKTDFGWVRRGCRVSSKSAEGQCPFDIFLLAGNRATNRFILHEIFLKVFQSFLRAFHNKVFIVTHSSNKSLAKVQSCVGAILRQPQHEPKVLNNDITKIIEEMP